LLTTLRGASPQEVPLLLTEDKTVADDFAFCGRASMGIHETTRPQGVLPGRPSPSTLRAPRSFWVVSRLSTSWAGGRFSDVNFERRGEAQLMAFGPTEPRLRLLAVAAPAAPHPPHRSAPWARGGEGEDGVKPLSFPTSPPFGRTSTPRPTAPPASRCQSRNSRRFP